MGQISNKRFGFRIMWQMALLAAAGSASLPAQTAAAVRAGSYEVGGFVGSSYGIDEFRWMGGGNVTYAATKYILPYAEFSYFPGIKRTKTVKAGADTFQSIFTVPPTDFHGRVPHTIPIRESP